MAIECDCPSCGANLEVAEEHAGRKVKCPQCAGAILVAEADASKEVPVAKPIEPPPRLPPVIAPERAAESVEMAEDSDPAGPEPAGGGLPNIMVGPPAGSPVGRRGGRTTRTTERSRPVWLLAGGISAIVLAVVVVAVLVYWFGGGWLGFSGSVLVLDWPESHRNGAAVLIDGQRHKLPRSGSVEFALEPGRHRIVMLRRGYQQVDARISLKANDRQRYRPRWTPSESAAFGPYRSPTSGGLWLRDVEAAKRRAAEENKDVLIALEGSDSQESWRQMWEEVFDQPVFREQMDWRFVLVRIDFPREDKAQAEAAESYRVCDDSMVVLTDAEGRPYAVAGHTEGDVEDFVKGVARGQSVGERLDQCFLNVKTSRGDAKLSAIQEAADLLTQALWRKMELIYFYEPMLDDWRNVARQSDPKNEQGAYEVAFAVSWIARLAKVDVTDPDAFRRVTGELDDWKKQYKFKDPGRAALMHAHAAIRLAEAGQSSEGEKQLEAANAYQPEEPFVAFMLQVAKAALRGYGGGSGSGFLVAADGYILTNHHVIEGEGKSSVRLPGRRELLPAKVLAQDAERDVALLKIELPEGIELAPLPIVTAEVPVGAEVGVFGFPLGEEFGTDVTFTSGPVAMKRGEGKERMLVLDCNVNPGNSGGPLCDSRGNVIGMVARKTLSSEFVGSYGMAIPAKDLRDFLTEHLPEYKNQAGSKPREDRLPWEDVSRIVSPSVLMITRSK